jgi:hypothetical protein
MAKLLKTPSAVPHGIGDSLGAGCQPIGNQQSHSKYPPHI